MRAQFTATQRRDVLPAGEIAPLDREPTLTHGVRPLDSQLVREFAPLEIGSIELPYIVPAIRGSSRCAGWSALGHINRLNERVARLEVRIDEAVDPFARQRNLLMTILGIGKRAVETIIAEIGVDMSRFLTADHLASWAGHVPWQQ